jgi:hypothetical protein
MIPIWKNEKRKENKFMFREKGQETKKHNLTGTLATVT